MTSALLTQRTDAGALRRYRIMAFATGFMLAFCCVVALPLRYGAGWTIMWVPWALHGWFFIAYILTALDLGIRRRWSLVKLAVVVLSGTIPFLVFFVEHRISRRVRVRSRFCAAVVALGLAVSLAACSGHSSGNSMAGMDMKHGMSTGLGQPATGKYDGFGLTPPQPRPNFVLTDEAGKSYSFGERTQGKPTLLFFGYTNCPDDCPTTMADIHLALTEVPAAVRAKTLVVFVTTDPTRDTGARIKKWLSQFQGGLPSANWIGLRGTRAELDAAQAAAHVTIAQDDGETHSLSVLLYGPDDYAHVSFALTDTERQQMVHDLPMVVAGK